MRTSNRDPDRSTTSRRRPVAKASAADGVSTAAATAAERRFAHEIAAKVNCDVRTALRAMRGGVEAVRPLRLREELQPHIDAWRASKPSERVA